MKRHIHLVAIAAIAGAIAAGAVQSLFSAFADQSERVPPTSGIFTGIQYSQKLGDAFRSVSTGNKGNIAPANVGGSAVDGLEWIDDSTTPWIKKRFVNGGWAVEGALDPTDSSYAGVIGGGIGSIASGSTVDLGSVPQANVTITGTVTITAFGSSAKSGVIKFIRFNNALILTNSASLTVPGGFDLTTAANDRAIVTHLGSGTWEITQYTRANGIPVDVSAVGKPTFSFGEALPGLHLYGNGGAILRTSYPAYLAKVTRVQNGTRTSGNATITSVGNTSAFGAGMPVEGTGISAGCTLASFVANTSITLNSSACVTSSGTSTVTVFLTGYGAAGDGTTVGVPNCGGAVLAGRETTPSRLTATYFGNSTAMAAFGGTESKNLSIANINSFTPTGSLSASFSSGNVPVPQQGNWSGGAGSGVSSAFSQGNNLGSPTVLNVGVTGNVTGSITIGALGSGTAHSIMQPTLIAECVVRVTP